MKPPLKAPFPYFGGKSRVAAEIWRRFGDVRNYVEPFFGSGAVLLGRPLPFDGAETVNDLDSMICNLWRSLQRAPNEVARWADWPVNEIDLYARHQWLLKRKAGLSEWLRSDPDACDPKAAGWWVWGISQWIGGGWCDDHGHVESRRPHLSHGGMGVHRRMYLGRSYEVHSKLPCIYHGEGVLRGEHRDRLDEYFAELSDRLRHVRVCCGDWSRVCGPAPTYFHGLTGVFLDPPYCADRADGCYVEDSGTASTEAREWAIQQGLNPLMRIALCGYEGEHDMPADWSVFAWATSGGMGRLGSNGQGIRNKVKERIWFSPACLGADAERTTQLSIFAGPRGGCAR